MIRELRFRDIVAGAIATAFVVIAWTVAIGFAVTVYRELFQ